MPSKLDKLKKPISEDCRGNWFYQKGTLFEGDVVKVIITKNNKFEND